MIELVDITLLFGERVLFGGINAVIGPRDRIGLVGSNGAGKSTLLKILQDPTPLDDGEIKRPRYVDIGYLPQDGITAAGQSLYKEVESAFQDILELRDLRDEAEKRLDEMDTSSPEFYETLELLGEWDHRLESLEEHKLKSKIETVLMGLGFSLADMQRDTGEFSGGWQMRIALAKLLLRNPSLLLLDEPTNHLDLPSLRWVENYMKQYDGAIMLVSHDRALLDRLCNRIFHLSMGSMGVYTGNFTAFQLEYQRRKEIALKEFKNQEKYFEQQQRFIERFRSKASKAAQVQSRVKMLDKIERVVLEREESVVHFKFPKSPRAGQVLLELSGAKKAFGDKVIFDGLNLKLERGDRVAVVGVNGAGKSTLLRILAGEEPLNAGEVKPGHNAQISYFGQHQAYELDLELDVFTTAKEAAKDASDTYVRTILGSFLFRGDDAYKKVKVLSGGEKNRVALSKMLLQAANCLLLDEPTNHLDMKSKETLQNALKDYDGSYVIVSHDRAFLDQLVNKVWEVSPQRLRVLPGNFSEYLAKLDEEEAAQRAAVAANTREGLSKLRDANKSGGGDSKAGAGGSSKEKSKQPAQSKEHLASLKKKLHLVEAEIAELEKKFNARKEAMTDPEFFKRGSASAEEVKEFHDWETQIERLYQMWNEATEAINQAEAELKR